MFFFKSKTKAEKDAIKAAKAAKITENRKAAIQKILTKSIPSLIDNLHYNQFEKVGADWFSIKTTVACFYGIHDPDLKKVSNLISQKLKLNGSLVDELFSFNEKNARFRYNQQMLLDKEYIIKLLNEYSDLVRQLPL